MTFDVELDLEIDGPFGFGRMQADGRSATFEPGGFGGLVRMAWWAARNRRTLARIRGRWTRHLGIPLFVRLPGGLRLPLIRSA